MTRARHEASWVRRYPEPHPAPAMRLFCFPYAGGGPSVFRDWRLPPELAVEVCAVHYPGREGRWDEPLLRRFEPLLRGCAENLAPLLDRPYAIFGHSMGALVAYELVRLLEREGGPLPTRLFLSGHRAPDRRPKRSPISALPDDAFVARLLEMTGSSVSAVRDRDLLLALAPITRADLELCEWYRHEPSGPLSPPVTCFAAVDDSEVDVPDVAAWSRYTTGGFRIQTYSGGHLFLRDHSGELLEEIAGDLVMTGHGARRRGRHAERRDRPPPAAGRAEDAGGGDGI